MTNRSTPGKQPPKKQTPNPQQTAAKKQAAAQKQAAAKQAAAKEQAAAKQRAAVKKSAAGPAARPKGAPAEPQQLPLVQRSLFRWVSLTVVLILLTALSTVFVVQAVNDKARKKIPTAATKRDEALDLGSVLDAPHIVFRSSAPGPTYGLVAAVPLAHPGGVRSVSQMSCDRVYATADAGICLAAQRGAVTRYSAELLNGRLVPQVPIGITGIPSRARLSSDSSWAATTAFIGGHGYGTIGFSTATTIVDGVTHQSLGNLEKTFTTLINGKKVTASDLNIWGVTFGPGPRPNLFYATVATGGNTWLARGDIAHRTLTAIREDAECPSLSPDGNTLIYKKRAGSQVRWRYHILDLKTGVETPLSETRSIDDQAEWLDNDHVLYGLARNDSGEIDVWVDTIHGPGKPTVFMRDASSPAVVRTASQAAPATPTPTVSGTETPNGQ